MTDSPSRARLKDRIARGARGYERPRHLPRLIPEDAWEEFRSAPQSIRRELIAHLERALRSERRRGRAGHWTYDLNRHIALVAALKAEREIGKKERKAARQPTSAAELRPPEAFPSADISTAGTQTS